VTAKYEITEFVGEGSFGQVCRARFAEPFAHGSPETVVIKRIVDIFHVSRPCCCIPHVTKTICVIVLFFALSYLHPKQSPADAKRCLREIAILRRLDHPNIIKVRFSRNESRAKSLNMR
jgi:serine/threonine protein kinase